MYLLPVRFQKWPWHDVGFFHRCLGSKTLRCKRCSGSMGSRTKRGNSSSGASGEFRLVSSKIGVGYGGLGSIIYEIFQYLKMKSKSRLVGGFNPSETHEQNVPNHQSVWVPKLGWALFMTYKCLRDSTCWKLPVSIMYMDFPYGRSALYSW